MEYTTETVEIEEICDDENPAKKFKKITKSYDQKFVTDWKNDPNYKNWVEKTRKDDETATLTTYQFDNGETTECIELTAEDPKSQIGQIEVKTVRKPNTANTTAPVKNTRGGKRQIKVLDPNLPAFVCTEHNENISLDCRYCRIASGFKKKNSQKHVQNDEISSSGKVTVAIPKRETNIVHPKVVNDGVFEGNSDTYNVSCHNDISMNASLQRNLSLGKYVQKFRSEWLKLPEFKDWLVECKMPEYGDMSQAQCKYCGTLLVNNSNNLVRHAISKKHMKNMELENLDFDTTQERQTTPQGQRTSVDGKSKEEVFGSYVASELKRIKNKKTYEEVKWKILQALQAAAEKEADDQDASTS